MIENFDGVIAIAPVVFCFDKEKGLDRTKFLENIEEMAEAGIRLMLFHPTAKHELWEMAEKRMWPTTSWNGSLLFRDMKLNNRNDSLVALLFEDILAILKKYNVTCDIGSVFRPARISEALDSVHLKELSLQEDYLLMAKRTGVLTIREAVGHISLDKIEDFANKVSPNTPIMPLPVSTDAAVGFDHVACAVATTMLGYFTNLGIINPVTRVEHTGDIPTLENTVEALMTAKTVAHSLDLRNIPQASRIDNLLSDLRQRGKVCHITGGLFDCEDIPRDHRCDRCDIHCPFLMKKER